MRPPTRRDRYGPPIRDAFDAEWLVIEWRPTRHGFDVGLGWPVDAGRGGPRLVPTAALVEYLQRVERPRDLDLPVGRSTLKRARVMLGLRFDWDCWWAARETDLRTMTLEAFAARHHCSTGAASQRRAALSGAAHIGGPPPLQPPLRMDSARRA